MNKHILVFFSLLFFLTSFSQDTLILNSIWTKTFNGNLIGAIDEQENCILSTGNDLVKLNNKGDILFRQSLKSLGIIKEIDARNPFKILLFSENQQSIGYCDNSLTFQNESIDLSGFDINNVVCVTGSDQMDKCWIYSQDNSILKLIGKNEQQFQTISNIKNLVDLKSIDKLIENNGSIFMLDYSGKVVQLDIYGNLKSTFIFPEFKNLIIENNNLYVQLNNLILIYSLVQRKQVGFIKTSTNSIIIGKKGDFLYFTNENKLSKFTLSN